MQNLVQGPATRIVGQHSPELQMRPSAVFHLYMNDSVDLTVFCMYFHVFSQYNISINLIIKDDSHT